MMPSFLELLLVYYAHFVIKNVSDFDDAKMKRKSKEKSCQQLPKYCGKCLDSLTTFGYLVNPIYWNLPFRLVTMFAGDKQYFLMERMFSLGTICTGNNV